MLKSSRLPEVTRGDPVQIKFATQDGYLWIDATVNWVDSAGNGIIGDTMADFNKKIVERDQWRHPDWKKDTAA